MSNKFLSSGTSDEVFDPTNCTLDICGASVRAITFAPSSAVVTDLDEKLQTIPLATFGVANPVGSVQFNEATIHGGDAEFTWDSVFKILTVNGIATDINGDITRGGVDYMHTKGGIECMASGLGANASNVSADRCTAFGFEALFSNIVENDNTAFGWHSGRLTENRNNCSFGSDSFSSNITGIQCCAFGVRALNNCTSGDNTAFGFESGFG